MTHHSLYSAPDLYDRLMPPGPCEGFYRPLAARIGGPVLDLACGTGRLAIPLAEDGHVVVGIDASARMLRAAREKARAAGVRLELAECDMRSLDLDRRFPLIIVPCNSLAHLVDGDEIVDVLERIARHLSPGGVLAFDVVNPRIAHLDRSRPRDGDADILVERSGVTVREDVLAYDAVSQVRVVRWHVSAGSGPGERTEAMRLRVFFPQELPVLLSAAGLELVARYGDYAGGPLTAESVTQACLARRSRADPRA